MRGRSGYTGEGRDSVMSSISCMDMIVCDFDDPGCPRSHDKATQVDAEKIEMEEKILILHLGVARHHFIHELEEQVRDNKLVVQQLHNDKLQQGSYLAFQNAMIEELEAKVDIINTKKDVAQQEKIKELEVLIEKLIRFSLPTFSIVVA